MVKKVDKPKKDPYSYEKHHFYLNKNAGKQVCAQCGLVGLNNAATQWCIDKGCNHKDHDSYERTMEKLTKLFDF